MPFFKAIEQAQVGKDACTSQRLTYRDCECDAFRASAMSPIVNAKTDCLVIYTGYKWSSSVNATENGESRE